MPLAYEILYSAIGASCLSGLTVYFYGRPPFYLKLFPVYLMITWMVELWSAWLVYQQQHTVGLYNVFGLLSTAFYMYVLHAVVGSRRAKKAIVWSVVFYELFAVWNMVFWQKMKDYNNVSAALSSLIIVIFCIIYFIEIFQRPRTTRLLTEPSFWICSGLIFFNICTLPYFGLSHLLYEFPRPLMKRITFTITVINILLYLTYSISFLCRLQIRKSTSSY